MADAEMNATPDGLRQLFEDVLQRLDEYKNTGSLSVEASHAVGEVVKRIRQEAGRYEQAMTLNERLYQDDKTRLSMSGAMSTPNVLKMLQEASKTDEALATWLQERGGQIAKVQSVGVSAFDMNQLESDDPIRNAELEQLQAQTEAIYDSLWKAKERLKAVNVFKNFNPKGVRDVRNQLILHIDKPDSQAYIYSFGLGTSGPILRPIRPQSARAISDPGLEVNIREFLNGILKKLI